jgi:hypothetical protein
MTSHKGFALRGVLPACVSVAALALAMPASAQAADREARLRQLEEKLTQQASELEAQQEQLDRQRSALERQRQDVADALAASDKADQPGTAPELIDLRAGQAGQRPVGVAPPPQEAAELAALPEGVGVLTPRGRFLFDPTIEYINSSSNRLVFRGVEIVTGVQVGVIEASDVDRNSVIGSLAVRYGVSDRLEIEARAPYVYRSDEITTLVQRDSTVTQTTELESNNLGDVELTARYQFTRGVNSAPVIVGNLRYKSDTGRSPFEVERDAAGIATELPTGSGFHGIEPSLTVLMPSDPAVLFGTLGYLWHLPEDIDRTINGVAIGRVDPGDSINGSLGFGFSINPRFSFSMSYRHSYIFPTETMLNNVAQQSDDLQSGALQLGMSYRFGAKTVVSTSFEFGVTEDAPDVRAVLRIPVS